MSDERKAVKEHAAHMARLRAMLKRLQDPDYVVKLIQECQRRGLIPADLEPPCGSPPASSSAC